MESKVIKELVPVDFANQRVLTYRQVAEGLQCSVDLLRMHFKNHPEQFEEGVHFFKLTGELLRNFRRQINDVYSPSTPLIGKSASSLIVWTCQGVARLSKLIDTPKAWELFTALELNYFKPAPQPLPDNKVLKTALEVPAAAPKTELDKLKEENFMLKNQLTKIACLEFAMVYVLLMSNGSVKIGMTKDLTERIKQIKAETGLDVFNARSTPSIPRDEARRLEKILLDKYADLNLGGEFFAARFDDVVADIKALCA